MLHYKDLTKEQKEKICNGCGGKGSIIPVPEFIFHADCNRHDFGYWRGCTEEDKIKTDNGYYMAMKIDCKEQSKNYFQYLFYRTWAYIYYKVVQKKGKDYFYYGKNPKTLEDVQLEEQKNDR